MFIEYDDSFFYPHQYLLFVFFGDVFIVEDHTICVVSSQLIVFTHSDRIYRTSICTLATKETTMLEIDYRCFITPPFHLYRFSGTDSLTGTASDAGFHIPYRPPSEILGHFLTFEGIFQCRGFSEEFLQCIC